MINATTITKTQNAQTIGIYHQTTVDASKADAEFLLVNVSPYVIRWKGGDRQVVTANKLSSLQKKFPNWMSDF